MAQGRRAWGQLAEHHVQIGDPEQSDASANADAERSFNGEGQRAHQIGEEMAECALSHPAKCERGEGDPYLAGREYTGEISSGGKRKSGDWISGPDHRLQPTAAGAHERELHRHEIAVEDKQYDDDR